MKFISGSVEKLGEVVVLSGVTLGEDANGRIQLTGAGSGVTVDASWKFSTTTTASDPGNKTFRLNNATLASATAIYVNDIDNEGFDVGTIVGFLASGNRIYVQQKSDATRAAVFQVSGAPTDNTGWWTIPVTVVNSATIYQNAADCGFVINFTAAGGTGAPTTATYITQTADAGLSNEQALGALATGLLKNTTTTGVLSIATASDYVAPARSIATTAPLSGGGDLSADRTLSINANGITDALFRTSAAASIVGRSAATTGNVADIASAADGDVLRRSGTTLGWGAIPQASVTGLVTALSGKAATTTTISTTSPLAGGGDLSANRTFSINTNGITNALFRQGAALSVVGVTGNATANVADIVAAADGQVLRRSGSALAFSSVAIGEITGAYNGTNLIRNGNAELPKTVNWSGTPSGWTRTIADGAPPANSWVWEVTGNDLNVYCDDLIPINPHDSYTMSAWLKRVANGTGTHYMGLACYDHLQRQIANSNIYAPNGVTSATTLGANVNGGDATITLTSAAGFPDESGSGFNTYCAVNVADDGSDLPNFQSYRYTSKTGNVLNLTSVIPGSGLVAASGTKVRFHRDGSTYDYNLISALAVGSLSASWTQYLGTASGTTALGASSSNTQFRYGTAYVKPLLLHANGGTGTNTVRIDDWKLQVSGTDGAFTIRGNGLEGGTSVLNVIGAGATNGDAWVVCAQGAGGSDMVVGIAGMDSGRTDGRTANNVYLDSAQTTEIRTKINGTTYSNRIIVGNTSTGGIYLYTAAQSASPVLRLTVDATGHMIPGATNSYDIGASATTFRSGYFGTSLVVGTDPTGSAILRVGGNIRIGSLGNFDSTVAPTTNQMLVYDSGTSLWKPKTVNFSMVTAGEVVASGAPNGTSANYFDDQAARNTGTATAPSAAPVLSPIYKGVIVDMSAHTLPANCTYVLQYSTDNATWFTVTERATEGKVVHSDLATATLYYYKFTTHGTSYATYSSSASTTTLSVPEVSALGIIIASQLSVAKLSAITGTIGDATADSLTTNTLVVNTSISTAGNFVSRKQQWSKTGAFNAPVNKIVIEDAGLTTQSASTLFVKGLYGDTNGSTTAAVLGNHSVLVGTTANKSNTTESDSWSGTASVDGAIDVWNNSWTLLASAATITINTNVTSVVSNLWTVTGTYTGTDTLVGNHLGIPLGRVIVETAIDGGAYGAVVSPVTVFDQELASGSFSIGITASPTTDISFRITTEARVPSDGSPPKIISGAATQAASGSAVTWQTFTGTEYWRRGLYLAGDTSRPHITMKPLTSTLPTTSTALPGELWYDGTNHKLSFVVGPTGSESIVSIGSGILSLGGVTTSAISLPPIVVPAGTTALAPLRITTGATLVTTPLAGSFEATGTVIYSTPSDSRRGVSPSVMFRAPTSNTGTGTNGTSAQAWLPGQSLFTLVANVGYFFEGQLVLVRSAGSGSHTTGISMDGGTATRTCGYVAMCNVGDVGTISTTNIVHSQVTSNINVKATSTSTTENITIFARGIIWCTVAGTFGPQFTYTTTAPGQAPTIKMGSYFRMWPLGANTDTLIG